MIYEELNLFDLDDGTLNTILDLEEKDKTLYIHHLIEKFFPSVVPNSEEYGDLQLSYRSSFKLEQHFRTDPVFHETFTLVYTPSGLIRDAVNDLYFTDDHLITH
tara:strand:- start:267 stop:578 length:312 start_codon:yes stop_codon:yes gene_type:complete